MHLLSPFSLNLPFYEHIKTSLVSIFTYCDEAKKAHKRPTDRVVEFLDSSKTI